MKIDQGSTITNLPKFLSRHESYISNMRDGKTRTAYLNRYNKVKEQLNNESTSASPN